MWKGMGSGRPFFSFNECGGQYSCHETTHLSYKSHHIEGQKAFSIVSISIHPCDPLYLTTWDEIQTYTQSTDQNPSTRVDELNLVYLIIYKLYK